MDETTNVIILHRKGTSINGLKGIFQSFLKTLCMVKILIWAHIKYQAANPANAANHVANRTCPVGCRRTAMAT